MTLDTTQTLAGDGASAASGPRATLSMEAGKPGVAIGAGAHAANRRWTPAVACVAGVAGGLPHIRAPIAA